MEKVKQFFKNLKTWQKVGILFGAVLMLGLMLSFGVSHDGFEGLNK